MATRKENLENPDSCLMKAAPDEPIFVLRAQDSLAPGVVRDWASKARIIGVDAAKVEEAEKCAAAMDAWHTHKTPD